VNFDVEREVGYGVAVGVGVPVADDADGLAAGLNVGAKVALGAMPSSVALGSAELWGDTTPLSPQLEIATAITTSATTRDPMTSRRPREVASGTCIPGGV
jgi:hypothetical protein